MDDVGKGSVAGSEKLRMTNLGRVLNVYFSQCTIIPNCLSSVARVLQCPHSFGRRLWSKLRMYHSSSFTYCVRNQAGAAPTQLI